MAEFFDTTQVPDDPQHWDEMARRVDMAASRAERESLLDWLASSRSACLAAPLIVAAILLLVVQAPDSSSSKAAEEWLPLVAPSDAAGRAMAVTDGPPDIDLLLESRLRSAR
jgi:hypothetical protein